MGREASSSSFSSSSSSSWPCSSRVVSTHSSFPASPIAVDPRQERWLECAACSG